MFAELIEAQETIRRQEEQLKDVQLAKKKLEEMEEERLSLLRALEEAKSADALERSQLVNIWSIVLHSFHAAGHICVG